MVHGVLLAPKNRDRRMKVLSSIVVALLVVVTNGYVFSLLLRVRFGQSPSTIGSDVVAIVYVLSLIALAWSVFFCFDKSVSKSVRLASVLLSGMPIVCFTLLLSLKWITGV